jgi:EEF1A lysine methyltransferase 1
MADEVCIAQYSDETATLLAQQLLEGATSETTVAAVSAPSVFVAMKNIIVSLVYLFPTA